MYSQVKQFIFWFELDRTFLGKERRFQASKGENRIAGLPLTHLQNKCFEELWHSGCGHENRCGWLEIGALLVLKVGSLGLLEWKGAGSTGVGCDPTHSGGGDTGEEGDEP